MPNKTRIPIDRIMRMESLEQKFGIDDMNIYAYMQSEDKLKILGEIYAQKLIMNTKIACTIYDKDGDVIATGVNNSYPKYNYDGGGGMSSNVIKKDSIEGLIAFKIVVSGIDCSNIDRIRIYPKE